MNSGSIDSVDRPFGFKEKGMIKRCQGMHISNTPWLKYILYIRPGNDLLSHRVSPAVSSALEGLTSVFGMGTGVSPPL